MLHIVATMFILSSKIVVYCIALLYIVSYSSELFKSSNLHWKQARLYWNLSFWQLWSSWVSLYTHSGQQGEAMISTSLGPFCSVLCLFLWSSHWFRYADFPALVTCIFKTPFAICNCICCIWFTNCGLIFMYLAADSVSAW